MSEQAFNTLPIEQITKRIKAAVTSSISALPNGKVGVAIITSDWDGFKLDENKKETTKAINFQPQADKMAKLFGQEGYGYDVRRLVIPSARSDGDFRQRDRDAEASSLLARQAVQWAREFSGDDDVSSSMSALMVTMPVRKIHNRTN